MAIDRSSNPIPTVFETPINEGIKPPQCHKYIITSMLYNTIMALLQTVAKLTCRSTIKEKRNIRLVLKRVRAKKLNLLFISWIDR